MKRIFLGLLILLVSMVYTSDTVALKRIMSINDETGAFYFKYPRNPVMNADGKIVIHDQKQLLIFDADGNFIKNVYRKGEGPGEIKEVIGIWPQKDFFTVFNGSPGKRMIFSYKGELIRELFFKKNLHKTNFLVQFEGKFFFAEEEYSNTRGGQTTRDTNVTIFSLDVKGNLLKYPHLSFPKKYYMSRTTVMNIHFVQYCWDSVSRLYLANNGLLDLKALDLKENKLIQLFKRDYKRVDIKPDWRKYSYPRTWKTRKKYYRFKLDDILRIRSVNDKIWLFTSTFEENNIIQVEVLHQNGKHLGTLRMQMPKNLPLPVLSWSPLRFYEDKLLVFENTEDGRELCLYTFTSIPHWAE